MSKMSMENNKIEFINSIIYLLQQNEKLILNTEISNSQKIQLLKNKVNILDFYSYEQDNQDIPVTVQESLLNNLNEILNIYDEKLSQQEKVDFWHYSKILTDNINQETITRSNILNDNVKTFLLYLKNDKKTLISRKNYDITLKIGNTEIDNLNNRVLKILDLKSDSNNLLLHGFFVSKFINENITIQLVKECKNKKQIFSCENIFSKKNNIFNDTIHDYQEFKVAVPLDNKEKSRIYFEIILNNEFTYIPSISIDNYNHNSKIVYPYYISIDEKSLNIERGYKFSLIMALYNSENYLHQSLDSIVNQDMAFRDDVQLILINDGSTDKSKEICMEYQNKYPENIIYLEQKNSGQATARNNGLKYIRGKYVNFIDSDDYFEKNTLKEVYNFFEKNYSSTDVVSIPIKFFERQNRFHNLHNKFKKSRVVDLLKEPNNPQLSAPSSFIKSEMFEEHKFPTNVFLSEDTILLNKILFRKKTIGLLNTTHYNYRKRFDNSSTIDSTQKNNSIILTQFKNYFMELINYSIEQDGEVIPYIQYLLAYDLQWFLKEPELNIIHEEQQEFKSLLNKILSYIDKKCIKNNQYVTYNIFISFFMYLKDGELKEIINENNIILRTKNHQIDSLKDHNIWIDIIEIKNGMLNISGFINSHFNDDKLSIYAEKEFDNKIEKYYAKSIKYTSRKDITYLSKVWQFKNSFDIKIPLSNEESKIRIRIDYLYDGYQDNKPDENVMPFYLNIKFTKYAKISEISNYIVKDNYLLTFVDNHFIIEKYSYSKLRVYEEIVQNRIIDKKSYNYVETLKLRKKYVNYYPLIRLFKKFFKIYIFSDRTDHADDNSEHLFRYANKQRDNVIKYFAVSKNSDDYKRLSGMGKVLDFNSKIHKWMYLLADKIISTHPYESNTNPFFSYDKNLDERDNICGLVTSDIYFLQHGVTKDDISDWMSKYDKNLSLLVTVNDQEKESFYNEGYGFDPEIIQTLGFPRYDNLKNNNNKQILIIPTWRKSLRGNKNIFVKSEYYKLLNDLLNNQELIDFAKENEYDIIFKAHPELEKNINDTDERYIDLFDINDYIKLSTQESYQELFNSSSLLITDYSSVFFDFAYEKKPVIYYQPTENHYQKGYFDYESMGFGEIVRDRNTLLKKIEEYVDNNCKMKDKYVERVNNFFKYTDKNNSKRVYEWIKKH